LNKLTNNEFVTYLCESIPKHLTGLNGFSTEKLAALAPVIRERITTRSEFATMAEAGEYDFAFAAPTYDTELLRWKNDTDVKAGHARLQNAVTILETADFSSPDTIKAALMPYAETVGKGELFWPLRTALSGRAQSPDPFTIAHIIGRGETISRLQTACDKLGE
jgi:glutamyl/glutaminyl-tRNA synthetase